MMFEPLLSKDIYVKHLSEREVNAFALLEHINLKKILPNYYLEDNVLYMEKGSHCSRLNLDIVKLYNDVLASLYDNKNSDFSMGIYSFMWSGLESKCESYMEYQCNEVETIKNRCYGSIADQYKCVFDKSYLRFCLYSKRYSKVFESEYVLLHGDLFNGNILDYGGEFKLIDFEYMRYGLKEIELAFLLCWDFITHAEICQYAKYIIMRNLNDLVENKCISSLSAKLICNCFIPMFVALACMFSSVGIYRENDAILNGCKELWTVIDGMLL